MKSPKRSKNPKAVRQSHQKKTTFKGKSLRGQPEIYDERKKPTGIGLTPTAVTGLDQIAAGMKISRSELVERIGRGILEVVAVNAGAKE